MADYWIKLYIEMLDDPKIGTLPDGLCWRFVQVCLLAGRFNQGGNIPNTPQLAWALRLNTNDLEHELQQLESVGLIERTVGGWFVKNFSKRQARMTNAEKQKAYRERLHHNQYTECVTTALPKVTQITDNREQITDNREEGAAPLFDTLKRTCETRGVLATTAADVKALSEWVSMGVIVEDVEGAIAWKVEHAPNGKSLYAYQLTGAVQTEFGKRRMGGNGRKPAMRTLVDANGNTIEVPA